MFRLLFLAWIYMTMHMVTYSQRIKEATYRASCRSAGAAYDGMSPMRINMRTVNYLKSVQRKHPSYSNDINLMVALSCRTWSKTA